MSRGKRRSASDDLLRATWEMQKEMEHLYKVSIRLDMVPVRFQRGVYDLHYQAWRLGQPESEPPPWQYTRSYPNAQTETLTGCIFVSLIQFERILADAHGYVAPAGWRIRP